MRLATRAAPHPHLHPPLRWSTLTRLC